VTRRDGRPTLDRDAIVTATRRLLEDEGTFTLRRLGAELGVDATAVYRHFRDRDDLLLAVGDAVVGEVLDSAQRSIGPRTSWRRAVTVLCTGLRATLVTRPPLADLVRTRPTLGPNELRFTEALLHHLRRSGLSARDIARGYHALIELTVGSAVIDAGMAALGDGERAEAYAAWRRTYATADPGTLPAVVATAPVLYLGTADDRFDEALALVLDGLERRAASRPSR
jgi:AcrR family transcriptional regulator